MYFIGVTTRHSSIHRVFPSWANLLRLGDAQLRGWDFPLHAPAASYRAALEFIKRDPRSLGALVTTHKMDLFAACRDQFDVLDPVTSALGEVSSIYKRGGRLHGRAVDPWTVGLALAAFQPPDHWATGAEVLVLGAGGAGTALVWHLNQVQGSQARPRRIHVLDPVHTRLDHLRRLQASWSDAVPLECHSAAPPGAADAVLAQLPAGSLVVNATGMGKDVPGSPLTPAAVFPERGLVWEFNYRGDLGFLQQARAQQAARALRIEDGWVYFLHGWTRVLADVFHLDLPTSGPLFAELGQMAGRARS